MAIHPRLRVVWRCVRIKCGGQCAMISGTTWMQELFVDNWASLDLVSWLDNIISIKTEYLIATDV